MSSQKTLVKACAISIISLISTLGLATSTATAAPVTAITYTSAPSEPSTQKTAKKKTTKKKVVSKKSLKKKVTKKKASMKHQKTRTKVVSKARSLVRTPYRSGGKTPRGFDCAGFTSYVYGKAGVKIPSTSSGQRAAGKRVKRSHAKPGDIIWTPGHVAIYLGGNKQIDAPKPGKRIHVRSIWQQNPTFLRF